MKEFGEIVIRQTIESLFEENTTDTIILDHFFQALIGFSEHFDIPHIEICTMILETGERKRYENGVVAAQFMNLLRQLRKGPWLSQYR